MNFLNLLGHRKQNNIYCEFIEAYTQLREMKNPLENLMRITRCLIEEHGEGRKRCMEYYMTHDIDRVILQLYTSEPVSVEDFYISVFPLCNETYLSGEFSRFIWRYNGFNRLCVVYCELCVVHNIFNDELALFLMERYSSNAFIQEGLVIVSKLESYKEFFVEKELSKSIINESSKVLRNRSSGAFRLMDLMCYAEDLFKASLVDELDLREIFNGSRKEDVAMEIETAGRNIIIYENGLLYFGELFRRVKSESFRIKIIKVSVSYIKEPAYIDFLVNCMMVDRVVMAGLLSERRKKATWKPIDVFKFLEEIRQNVDEEEIIENLLNQIFINETASKEKASENVLMDYNSKSGNIKTLFNVEKYKINQFPLLNYLLENELSDTRIYIFLYFVAPMTFYSRFHEIIRISKEREILLRIILLHMCN